METATMHHREFEPPVALQDSIKCFWYNKREAGDIASGFEVVPDGNTEIIFHFGSPCSILHNGVLQPLPSPFMIGLLNRPVHFYSGKRLEIIAIRCYPWTVFDLLGLASGKGGVHTFEHPVAKLHAVLEACVLSGNIEAAIACVSDYFLEAHAQVPANSMLFKAGAAMNKAKGNLPVSGIAEAAHATVRTLERKFKESSGHTVKDVSGLLRFEQVRNRLWLDPNTNLAGLAHELGYTDQSHLSREFKRYTGTTPAAFARKAKKEGTGLTDNIAGFVQP